MPESAVAAALGSKLFSIVDKFGNKNREKIDLILTFAPKIASKWTSFPAYRLSSFAALPRAVAAIATTWGGRTRVYSSMWASAQSK